MIIIKKNVVLKDAETGGTGVLKLERFMNRTSGRISLNCPQSSKAYIDIDGHVTKVDALSPFDLDTEITQTSEIKAVVANDGTIIATGNSAGGKFNYAAVINAVDGDSLIYSSQNDVEQAQSEIDVAAEAEDTEQASDITNADDMSADTAPDSAVVAQDISEVKASATKSRKRKGGRPSFIESIRNNLQQLFDTFPAEEKLCAMMPSSRWVRVPTEEDGYYVVGIIEEEGTPKYLCYGIPDSNNTTPPKSRPECRDWLTVEEDGSGYWLMYQDLESGEILKK